MNRIRRVSERSHHEEILKVCVVFDTGASARCAKEFIRRVCQTELFDTRLLQLDEHLLLNRRDDSARIASDVNLLVVAMQTDYGLPSFAKDWLARWINFRAEELEGALVALVTNSMAPPDSDSDLIAHLETVAVVGRLAFFYGYAGEQDQSYKVEPAVLLPFAARRLSDMSRRGT
jgi:hypothetical protein